MGSDVVQLVGHVGKDQTLWWEDAKLVRRFGFVVFEKKWCIDLRKSKLIPRDDGPFKVLEKFNENISKLDLHVKFGLVPHVTLHI
jgi:hypothetical protein